MKTQNIWVPVIIHFLNNNMAVVFSGTYSAGSASEPADPLGGYTGCSCIEFADFRMGDLYEAV